MHDGGYRPSVGDEVGHGNLTSKLSELTSSGDAVATNQLLGLVLCELVGVRHVLGELAEDIRRQRGIETRKKQTGKKKAETG